MARRHFKYIVRDQYGFVIQNAKVNVYQPGTTTNFLGAAYTLESGGSAVTNPITTNNQGEAEGWFDTSQSVDVQVDDNSDAAYRAVLGSTSTVSFTTFTEKDVILPFISDTSADISTIDPGDATAVGTTGRAADAGHQHQNTGLPNAHGAAQHTDVTRQLYLPAAISTPQVGALASIGTYPNIIRVTTLADAVNTNGAFWHFTVPDDWASGALTFQPIWVPGSTDGTAHTVRWQYDVKELPDAADVTAAGTTTAWTGASATRTANLIVYDTATSGGVTPAAAGNVIRFAVTRLGTDGADTYVGVVNLAGIVVRYTANQ